MPEVASSCEQAAATALRAFLATWSGLSGVTITDKWPAPDKPLPDKAITVLLVGRRQELPLDPKIVGPGVDTTPPDPDGIQKVYRWQVAACTQGVQLDVWSKYNAIRDQLVAELDKALHAGAKTTLGSAYKGLPFRDGPLVALDPATGFTGFADFTFDGPSLADSPDAARLQEYRATWTGEVAVNLELTATSPKIIKTVLELLRGGATAAFTFTSGDGFSETYTPP